MKLKSYTSNNNILEDMIPPETMTADPGKEISLGNISSKSRESGPDKSGGYLREVKRFIERVYGKKI